MSEKSLQNASVIFKRSFEKRKQRFLKAYEANGFNVSDACRKTGVRRDVIYRWKKDDPEFANAMWEIEESIKDFVESQMIKQIRNNNPAMIMWFLETKGKNRGYTRKFEVENNVKIELNTEQIDAMVHAHEIALKDDAGKLKLPPKEIESPKEDTDDVIDAEYRRTGVDNTESEKETAGSEVSGS